MRRGIPGPKCVSRAAQRAGQGLRLEPRAPRRYLQRRRATVVPRPRVAGPGTSSGFLVRGCRSGSRADRDHLRIAGGRRGRSGRGHAALSRLAGRPRALERRSPGAHLAPGGAGEGCDVLGRALGTWARTFLFLVALLIGPVGGWRRLSPLGATTTPHGGGLHSRHRSLVRSLRRLLFRSALSMTSAGRRPAKCPRPSCPSTRSRGTVKGALWWLDRL